MRTTIGRILVPLALAACLVAAEANAQCYGWALPASTVSGSTGCNFLTNVVPRLTWSFQLNCMDECGQIWYSFPVGTATARGSCNLLPPFQVCVPVFDQLDHANGLYGVTTARDQDLFLGGCSYGTVHFTQGNCPCAPDCSRSIEPELIPPGYGSPVLLSLGDGRFELTSAADGVRFDIDGDGSPERIAWTSAGSDEAFLALDRDGSGAIESGLELFGDSSPQLPAADANGFRALALFDEPQNGGDGDGWVGPGDEVFDHLLLWRDLDHDGTSTPAELTSATAAGLEGIDLDYLASARQDAHGNQFRYQAATRWRSGAQRPAWDVFFEVLPAEE
jgi:hypothetical protein